MVQNTFTLGESRTCICIARGCSVPQICLLPTSFALGYKSLRELICRCLSNAGANAVYKVSYAGVFLPLAKRLLKAFEVQD